MKRKIIQIASEYLGEKYVEPSTVLALCNDGTVWSLNEDRKGWGKLPDIPQDKLKKYNGDI